jgi:hypothetical protein
MSLILINSRANLRLYICIIFLFVTIVTFSQEKPGIADRKLKASASFSLNSNGIASIPAFSLGAPALVSSMNLVKGRFSYDPTLAYSLELKPWYIDNWFHYKIVVRPKWELKTGFNLSTFCSGYKVNDEEIMKAERYFAFSLAGTWKFNPTTSLTLDYWNDNGQEPESLSGHFIDLIAEKNDMPLGNKVLISANLQLFYINYDGNNDGLFISPKISSSVKNIPLTLFFQVNQGILSNVTPFPGFTWNVGLSYSL